MTAQVKAEIANTHITKTCCRKAEVSTMLRFAGGLHIVSGKIVVEVELDTGAAARRLRKAIVDFRFAWKNRSFTIGVSIGLVNLAEGPHTLASVLSARGYATAAFVSSRVLDRRFGLDEVVDALRYVNDGRVRGKAVIVAQTPAAT